MLFKGMGIDKIGLVTYSADAIFSLMCAQIQNIINLYFAECQKVICVKSSSRSCDIPTESQVSNESGSKKLPDVRISTPTYISDFKNQCIKGASEESKS
jgi:hypothetical protein